MPVLLRCDRFVLSKDEVEKLWVETILLRKYADDRVNVKCVSEQAIRTLNQEYRSKDEATNVLTFSYDGEHDIALCLEVAKQEAKERDVDLRDYVAWLLVHAFLHATGLDHEESEAEELDMKKAEHEILAKDGFADGSL